MYDLRDRAKKYGLKAPPEYFTIDDATLNMLTGGCGPGRFGNHGWFDRAWGVNLKPACRIHDYEYSVGETKEEKDIADLRFLGNMLRIIKQESRFKFLRLLRNQRALTYYDTVSMCGDEAFEDATVT